MAVQLLDAPFPHVYATDFFNQKELSLIRQELCFLTTPGKLLAPGVHHGAGGLNGLTSSKALHLEKAYTIPEISNILQVTKKTLNDPLITTIVSKWPFFMRLRFIDLMITKVRYYHNGEDYKPHTDIGHDFLSFMYFHSSPKKFNGGEIYFPDYNYSVDCSDNTFILIPSYVQHGVNKVEINDDNYWEGNGRYCISQFMSIKNRETYV